MTRLHESVANQATGWDEVESALLRARWLQCEDYGPRYREMQPFDPMPTLFAASDAACRSVIALEYLLFALALGGEPLGACLRFFGRLAASLRRDL